MLNRFAPFAGAVLWKIGASLLCSSGSKAASFACGPLFEVSPVLEVAEAKCQPLTVLYMCTGLIMRSQYDLKPSGMLSVEGLCSFVVYPRSFSLSFHCRASSTSIKLRIHGFRMHSASLLPAWRCVPDRLLTAQGHLLAG